MQRQHSHFFHFASPGPGNGDGGCGEEVGERSGDGGGEGGVGVGGGGGGGGGTSPVLGLLEVIGTEVVVIAVSYVCVGCGDVGMWRCGKLGGGGIKGPYLQRWVLEVQVGPFFSFLFCLCLCLCLLLIHSLTALEFQDMMRTSVTINC